MSDSQDRATTLLLKEFIESKFSDLMNIFVPSYNRSGIAPLLNMMTDAHPRIQQKIHVIVREDQLQDYRDTYPHMKILTVIDGEAGVGPAKMSCLTRADELGYDRIIMMDDDITHVSVLQSIINSSGNRHSQRYSPRKSGIPEPMTTIRALTVTSIIADRVMDSDDRIAYGGIRNALFSGGVDTSESVLINQSSFPSCVMIFDLGRFKTRQLPSEYQFYGEDIAMWMENYSHDHDQFIIQTVAYDQSSNLETTVPLDPEDEEGRRIDMDNARVVYPDLYPFLRESYLNSNGGVKRIGIRWDRLNKETGREKRKIRTEDLLCS